jgi:hypothetical protein
MFADDTCCLDPDKILNNLLTEVNLEMNKIAVWIKANKMASNTTKQIYIFLQKKKNNPDNLNVVYNANDPDDVPNLDLIMPSK